MARFVKPAGLTKISSNPNIIIWVIIGVVLIVLLLLLSSGGNRYQDIKTPSKATDYINNEINQHQEEFMQAQAPVDTTQLKQDIDSMVSENPRKQSTVKNWFSESKEQFDSGKYVEHYNYTPQSQTQGSIQFSLEKYYNRGKAECDSGRYVNAIDNFSMVINIDPNLAEAYILRGYSKYNLKNYDGAKDDWERAIAIDPTYKAMLQPYISKMEASHDTEVINNNQGNMGIEPNQQNNKPKNNEKKPQPPCKKCNDAGKVNCPKCGGKGKIDIPCPVCSGTGQGKGLENICPSCRGSGRAKEICNRCGGKGWNVCPICGGTHFSDKYHEYNKQ